MRRAAIAPRVAWAAGWHPWRRRSLQVQVREDPRDDRRFEDGGDDLELAAVDRAAQDVLVMRLDAARRDRLFLAVTVSSRKAADQRPDLNVG